MSAEVLRKEIASLKAVLADEDAEPVAKTKAAKRLAELRNAFKAALAKPGDQLTLRFK